MERDRRPHYLKNTHPKSGENACLQILGHAGKERKQSGFHTVPSSLNVDKVGGLNVIDCSIFLNSACRFLHMFGKNAANEPIWRIE
jgi:hypothetical protein